MFETRLKLKNETRVTGKDPSELPNALWSFSSCQKSAVIVAQTYISIQ